MKVSLCRQGFFHPIYLSTHITNAWSILSYLIHQSLRVLRAFYNVECIFFKFGLMGKNHVFHQADDFFLKKLEFLGDGPTLPPQCHVSTQEVAGLSKGLHIEPPWSLSKAGYLGCWWDVMGLLHLCVSTWWGDDLNLQKDTGVVMWWARGPEFYKKKSDSCEIRSRFKKKHVKQKSLHSGKLTWQWKIHPLKMCFLVKMGIVHCHVSLAKGTTYVFTWTVWRKPLLKKKRSRFDFLVNPGNYSTTPKWMMYMLAGWEIFAWEDAIFWESSQRPHSGEPSDEDTEMLL